MASSSSSHPGQSGDRRFSTNGESLYKILELEKGASAEQVKKAYRKLALQYHPDKNPDPSAAERFKEVSHANHVLSDANRKAIYDKYGSLGLQLAAQLGEENVASYLVFDNICCKILIVMGFILTGCCCCCCCCFCCGKCLPKDDFDEENFRPPGSDDPIQTQPQASSGANERSQLNSSEQQANKYRSTGDADY